MTPRRRLLCYINRCFTICAIWTIARMAARRALANCSAALTGLLSTTLSFPEKVGRPL